MIEPTDEMVRAFRAAFNDKATEFAARAPDFIEGGEITIAGLAAVLAVVERDYDVRPRRTLPAIGTTQCGTAGPAGLSCERTPGHRGDLLDRQHGAYVDESGELVRW